MKFKQLLIIAFMLSGFVAAGQLGQTGVTAGSNQQNNQTPQTKTAKPDTTKIRGKIVDYMADVAKRVPNDTVMRLVGNVIFHHNGAIIQCDSALRYDDRRMDCFGRVIINQDSTYIYGDYLTYDGYHDLATVHSPLIKITNGKETVMYTYALVFNTFTSIGTFSQGGIVMQRDNFMEAERGAYNSNTNDVTLNDNVSMRNNDYLLKTDSLKFNLDTEITTFLTRTYIWDSERDFLTSESGNYNNKTRTYTFTQKAYILTPDQEVWADSVIYHSLTKEAFLRRNVQILDTTQKTLAFADWAYYNDSIKKAILSNTPSIRNWDENSDTTYMRGDSIYMETFPRGTTKPDSTLLNNPPDEQLSEPDSAHTGKPLMDSTGKPMLDSLGNPMFEPQKKEIFDSTERKSLNASRKPILDSLGKPVLDSLGNPLFETLKEDSLNNTVPKILDTTNKPVLDSTTKTVKDPIIENNTENTSPQGTLPSPWSEPVITVRANIITKKVTTKISKPTPDSTSKQMQDSLESHTLDTTSKYILDSLGKPVLDSSGKPTLDTTPKYILDSLGKPVLYSSGKPILDATPKYILDSLGKPVLDSSGKPILDNTPKYILDSLGKPVLDSLGRPMLDTTAQDSLVNAKAKTDTTERLIRVFHNMKSFSKDFQSVCDSLVSYSVDSTMTMFGHPVLWNDKNQITADQIEVFTQNEEIDWVDFIGTPFILQQVDSARYNQAKGRALQAYFKKGEIDYTNMKGNVMNYYYYQDEEDEEVVGFASMESAELEMFFEKRAPTRMNWIGQSDWTIYPIDQIPAEQPQRLEGFNWITDNKPTSRYDIDRRTEVPTMRAQAEAYTKPSFEIEAKILAYKEQLIQEQRWKDRVDQPLYKADHFKNEGTFLQP